MVGSGPGASEEGEGGDLDEIRARLRREILAGQRTPAPAPSATAGRPVDLRRGGFESFLTAHERVAVDVWAPWCGPCRAFSPILEGLARRLHPHVAFGKVNADEEPEIVSRFGVEGIPTVLVFRSGRLVDRWAGAYPGEVVEGRLRRALGLVPPGPESSASA